MPDDNVLVSFRVTPEVARRIDEAASYSGHSRSHFLRLAVALTDSSMVVDESVRLAASGVQPVGSSEAEKAARETIANVIASLRPKPMMTSRN